MALPIQFQKDLAPGMPLDINLGTVWVTARGATSQMYDYDKVYTPVTPLTPIDTYKQMVKDLKKQITDLLTVNSRRVEANCPVQPVPPAESFPLRALQHRKQQVGLLVPFGD